MATFAKSTFNSASYAAFRPTYPPALYNTVLNYHRGPKNLVVDLGCGHGIVPRYLSKEFKQAIGTDPSPNMIKQSKESTSSSEYPNVEFHVASAESLPFIKDGSVDMVVAGQAAHWFDYPRLFPELNRVLRKGGTMAFWGYKDHVYVSYPAASKMLVEYSYGMDQEKQLGSYWSQPGRSILQDKLRPIKPPEDIFEDITRLEYEAGTEGPNSGEGTMFVNKKMTMKQSMDYMRTWSSFHEWEKLHPNDKKRSEARSGDLIDWMYDEMKKAEGWTDEDMELDIEWGSGLLMARKRE
ncbi:S-adenosyl-L-methionine-dependent methyltransferase [Tothia fuscella]|uniref:S-adenosyl-L-methionine-dependent methyltransferase n=1 Tax=Tothia fuscella TaxID=1048955 RepID=A0A9P4TV60_9PEZI|nr:S-adenosyl-L-methionine-dependent methyltransferase [Tothia fuscella]